MTPVLATLLIVDDETAQLRALCDTLELENYAVRDRKSTRLNSSHLARSRMPSSA